MKKLGSEIRPRRLLRNEIEQDRSKGYPIREGKFCAKIEYSSEGLVHFYEGKFTDNPDLYIGSLLFIYPAIAKREYVRHEKWDNLVQDLLNDGDFLVHVFSQLKSKI